MNIYINRTSAIGLVIGLIGALLIVSCKKDKTNKSGGGTNGPVITSISIGSALPTSVIIITGKNFSTNITNNSVTINGETAVVDSVNATQVWFTVPADAQSGIIKLVTGGTTVSYATIFKVTSPTFSWYQSDTVYMEHIVIDAANNIFGDNGTDTVYKMPVGSKAKAFAIIPPTNTTYNELWGTAIDSLGNIYEVSSSARKIYKITPAGAVSTLAGSGAQGYTDAQGASAVFYSPLGLAIDKAGNLYTNDKHCVRKITPAGLVSTVAGNGTDGLIDGPAKSAEFGNTEGIAVDAQGNIFVSDNEKLNIRKISTAGIVSTFAGSGTAGFDDGQGKNAQFYYPQAMAIDAAGNLFVADNEFDTQFYYTVRMINREGLVTTFANSNTANVTFTDGIAFDKQGDIFICNTLNTWQGASITEGIFK